ncbi:MAG: winged helix-turn-helix domain-containing protein [Actinobacteria bacterium]|nr:winged helix-turn-helix domain-containing protein [Actinomycetota bacterium]MCA1738032.1 winged helix-turn-helix domain-containing protein [Actinomycetota bacterium]
MGKKANLSWKDALVRVLDDAASTMHYTDIADSTVERGLRQKVGATPANTVASNITT